MKTFHLTATRLIKVLLVQENDHFEIDYYNYFLNQSLTSEHWKQKIANPLQICKCNGQLI